MQWVEIPDLAPGKLTVSSLLLSETTKDAEAANAMRHNSGSYFSTDRRFARSVEVRFLVFTYNAGARRKFAFRCRATGAILRDDNLS